jgi:hypothetical protein
MKKRFVNLRSKHTYLLDVFFTISHIRDYAIVTLNLFGFEFGRIMYLLPCITNGKIPSEFGPLRLLVLPKLNTHSNERNRKTRKHLNTRGTDTTTQLNPPPRGTKNQQQS